MSQPKTPSRPRQKLKVRPHRPYKWLRKEDVLLLWCFLRLRKDGFGYSLAIEQAVIEARKMGCRILTVEAARKRIELRLKYLDSLEDPEVDEDERQEALREYLVGPPGSDPKVAKMLAEVLSWRGYAGQANFGRRKPYVRRVGGIDSRPRDPRRKTDDPT